MVAFTDRLREEVRLERMRPEQIDAAKQRNPSIYVPFGSIEWHGYHNPVGLDGLKAHEQLVGLALRSGGVVYPPVYFGAGGGHTEWPCTYMVESEPMERLVYRLLQLFEGDGFRHCVLLSGHYPNRKAYLDRAAALYAEAGGTMRVLALIEHEAPGVQGDHAALYETSSMLYLDPQTVDMHRLEQGSADDAGGPDQRKNWMGDEYKGHPCYGLVGIDPRGRASAEVGRVNTDALIDFLAEWLAGERRP